MINIGPKNKVGPEGQKGKQGIPGLDGDRGVKGKNGVPGPKGLKGEKGKPGLNGRSIQGPAGASGDEMKGIVINVSGELSLAKDATGELVTYTVPSTPRKKNGQLLSVLVSGPNIADYPIEINGSKIHTARTHYLEFDDMVEFKNLRLKTGDVVTVDAVNCGTTTEIFEATILVDEFEVE